VVKKGVLASSTAVARGRGTGHSSLSLFDGGSLFVAAARGGGTGHSSLIWIVGCGKQRYLLMMV
jgi:hypothetical protein